MFLSLPKCISYENFPRKYVALCCWLRLSTKLCICNENYSKISSTLPFASGFIINANCNQPTNQSQEFDTNKIVPSVIICTHLHVYNVLNIFHILVQNFFFMVWCGLGYLTCVWPLYIHGIYSSIHLVENLHSHRITLEKVCFLVGRRVDCSPFVQTTFSDT